MGHLTRTSCFLAFQDLAAVQQRKKGLVLMMVLVFVCHEFGVVAADHLGIRAVLHSHRGNTGKIDVFDRRTRLKKDEVVLSGGLGLSMTNLPALRRHFPQFTTDLSDLLKQHAEQVPYHRVASQFLNPSLIRI